MDEDFQPQGLSVQRMKIAALTHPDLMQCINLWGEWCMGCEAPAWKNVKLVQLPPAILPLTAIVDVIEGGTDFVYRYWGTGLTEIFGRDDTGVRISQLSTKSSSRLRLEQFREVVAEAKPAAFKTEFAKDQYRVTSKINLRLPIMDTPGTVTKIISHSNIAAPDERTKKGLAQIWAEIEEIPQQP